MTNTLTLSDLLCFTGAKSEEVILMNGLSVNIHMMLVCKPNHTTLAATFVGCLHFACCYMQLAFYRPEGKRTKLVVDSRTFPSDLVCDVTCLEMQILLKN